MELLTSPTSAYLLEASLDVLHFESKEWQEELAFMQDEIRFLDNLLEKNMAQFSGNKGHYEPIHEQVRKIRNQQLNQLMNDIQAHERYLGQLLTHEHLSQDSLWREDHRRIKERLASFRAEYKQLKKQVFDLMESL